MHRRINITLPGETLVLIDSVTKRGDRSGLIDAAIRHYVETKGRARLRRRLKQGAQRREQRDLQLAADWFAIGDEVWPNRQK